MHNLIRFIEPLSDWSKIAGKRKIDLYFREVHIPNRAVVGCFRNNVYASAADGKVYRSQDCGKTWSLYLDKQVNCVYSSRYDYNVQLAFASDGIWRTADNGATWSNVRSSTNKTTLYHSVDESNSALIYAEYGGVDGNFYIARSADRGATWSNVLTKVRPTDLEHFHNVKYIFDLQKWIVTYGDWDNKVGWLESIDDGLTWSLITTTQGSQVYRTLNILFLPKGKNSGDFVWAMDAYSSYGASPAVYSAPANDLSIPTRLLTLFDNCAYCMAGNGPIIVVAQSTESRSSFKSAGIFISLDEGKTWELFKAYPVTDPTRIQGFLYIYGPDIEGSFYLRATGLKGRSSYHTIKLEFIV